MGSIVPYTKADKANGKSITLFRAYVRRAGYASKSKVLATLINEFMNAGNCAWARMSQMDFWVEQFGKMRVRDITHADINGAIPTDRKRTPATVNRYLAALSKVLSFALQHGVIEHHPMKGGKVSKLKEGGGRTRGRCCARRASN